MDIVTGCLFTITLVLIFGIFYEIKTYRKGMQVLVLDKLIKNYNFHTTRQKWISIRTLDSCLDMIKQYHALGGKRNTDDIYNALMGLPNDPT